MAKIVKNYYKDKKFKIGDVVYWISSSENNLRYYEVVIEMTSNILNGDDEKTIPIKIKDIRNGSEGWMPEQELFMADEVFQVLYGNKSN